MVQRVLAVDLVAALLNQVCEKVTLGGGSKPARYTRSDAESGARQVSRPTTMDFARPETFFFAFFAIFRLRQAYGATSFAAISLRQMSTTLAGLTPHVSG